MRDRERLRLEVSGAVQGVGFRPFVYRLARELQLTGWVINDGRGVFIEVEGGRDRLESFLSRIERECPPRAVVMDLVARWLSATGFTDFSIRESDASGPPTVVVLPDVASCSDCIRETVKTTDRRHRYPFTNCTNCGPRFSIIQSLPYDRPNTTMRGFRMCKNCRREYEDPLDRRFHAQPNACPKCGPTVKLLGTSGSEIEGGDAAMRRTVEALADGRIVALKGLGGFLLLADASREKPVAELRSRKRREEKPLAIMVPDVQTARRLCLVDEAALRMLTSPEAPIVLLDRRADAGDPRIADVVAPDGRRLGIMLPCTPLHHLLATDFGGPLVATSGNVSDEPICIGDDEALDRLGGIADLFLVHDRPIERHVDDSVVQFVDGAPQLLRRARGYAPLPVRTAETLPTILAVGGHLKNVAALSIGNTVFLSQHIGDMETAQAREAFERVVVDFLELYRAEPVCVACDMHPDYPSTKWAESATAGGLVDSPSSLESLRGLPVISVQHHHAHLAACLAEHGIEGDALGVVWDGTGFGPDDTVWGGEFLTGGARSFQRFAALRPFRLAGGDAAVREPRRSALGLLWEVVGGEALDLEGLPPIADLSAGELKPLSGMLSSGFHSPLTTSAGRLFDGIASLVGLRQRTAFEGQAAMMLEDAAAPGEKGAYAFSVVAWDGTEGLQTADSAGGRPKWMVDWRPVVEEVLEDSRRSKGPGIISARFHNGLVEAIVEIARLSGEERVALTGGCFQNRLLSERAAVRLRKAGFEVLQHRLVPANDGGLSLGQIAVVGARLTSEKEKG